MDVSKGIFIILTTIQIPSLYCAGHLFYRYFQRRSPLRRLQNHVLMCLLIVATWAITIELPNTQKYVWTGSATIHSSWFCSFWNTSFFSTSTLNRVLMAFMCVERHFLVFRPQTYQTQRSRLLFHYIPLIFIVSSFFLYLFITSGIITCPQVRFSYSLFMCGYTCSVIVSELGIVYTWVLVFIPTAVTVVGCILLPIRFIIQKRQLQQVQWHRARKMIVQTAAIASVYSICWLSYTVILQLLLNNILSFFDPNIGRFFTTTPYITSLMTPFIVIHTTEKPINLTIINGIKRCFFPQRQGAVHPVNNVVVQQQNRSANENRTSARQLQVVKNAFCSSLKSQ